MDCSKGEKCEPINTQALSCSGEQAVEGYRTPRRLANVEAMGKSARAWSAPVPWRFGTGLQMEDGRYLALGFFTVGAKAVEDYRTPRRFANVQNPLPL